MVVIDIHVIEPETWSRVVARVNGANAGASYAHQSGNIMGNIKISKPPGHTWKSFARLLLAGMPAHTREHYENKIAVFRSWWTTRGYPHDIPDELDAGVEADKTGPSWRRVCKALLRHDYWCKGMSFSQHRSASYEKYRKIMRRRRERWNLI
jgi:predicted phosphoadenosine phosphosulfate sulfurtransferase